MLDGHKVQPHSNLIAARTHICKHKKQDTIYAIDTLRLGRGGLLFCAPLLPRRHQGEQEEHGCMCSCRMFKVELVRVVPQRVQKHTHTAHHTRCDGSARQHTPNWSLLSAEFLRLILKQKVFSKKKASVRFQRPRTSAATRPQMTRNDPDPQQEIQNKTGNCSQFSILWKSIVCIKNRN